MNKIDFCFNKGVPIFVTAAQGQRFRRVFGATFSKNTGCWLFPAYPPSSEDTVADLKKVAPELEFTARAEEGASYSGAPEDFNFHVSPFTHQKETLDFALKNLRCALWLDCGLGKTGVIVNLVRVLKKKVLVLSPVVGIETWFNEVAFHSNGELNAVRVKGSPLQKKAAIAGACENNVDILIMGYDSAPNYMDYLRSFPYEIIVADESHNLRDHRSRRTKAALKLSTQAARRIVMSGTPTFGNPLSLYGQLAFLAPYIPAPDYWTFRRHHIIHVKGNPRLVTGYKNLDLLRDKIERISIRKTKEECLDLPPRTVIDVTFDLEGDQKKLYNDLVTQACVDLGNGVLYDGDNAAVTLQKLLQVLSGFFILPPPNVCDGCEHVLACVEQKIKPFTRSCHNHPVPLHQKTKHLKKNPKLVALMDLIDSIGEKTIVWFTYTEEGNIIANELVKQGISFVKVDGSNSSKAAELVQEFNTNKETQVYLSQISMGTAITLNSAAYMIYYNLSFRLDHYLQSVDRNYRIGQKRPVFVYRLFAKNSILEFVMHTLAAKLDLSEILTAKIDCALCDRSQKCFIEKVEPFKKGCRYRSRVNRVIARPKKL